jgi:hypothetical protein
MLRSTFLYRFGSRGARVGLLWLGLILLFEWGGSLAIGRLVEEILLGWNVSASYMWPYVLLVYLSPNLIVRMSSARVSDERARSVKPNSSIRAI